VFDEHPDTVRFLVPGDRLYEALLAEVRSPEVVADNAPRTRPAIIRAEVDGVVPRVAYYARSGDGWERLDTLAELEQVLGQVVDGEVPWTSEALAAIQHDAEALAAADIERLRRTISLDLEGERLALQERGRDVLLRAAHIELALGQQPELMGSDYPWEFGPGAIEGLRRHKYPWAPLLKLVDVADLVPAAIDPYQ
jgi:hypothetical protein